jgi:hypothetical protein
MTYAVCHKHIKAFRPSLFLQKNYFPGERKKREKREKETKKK